MAWEDAFDIVDDAWGGGEGVDVEGEELVVGDGKDDCIVLGGFRKLCDDVDIVFSLDRGRIGPWVVDGDVGGVFEEGVVDIYYLGIADVRTVLFEGDAEDKDLGVLDTDTFLVHALDCLVGYIGTHAVVESASIKHNAREDSIDLCLLDEVIGIDTDTVPAHKSGAEFDEVPFAGGCLDDVAGVDVHGIEDFGEFVHEGDIDVALGVLDNLTGLGDFHGRCLMCAVDKYGVINSVNDISDLWCGARSDLADFLDCMLLIAWVDTLGRVTGKEVLVERQSGNTFYDREAFLLGNSRIDGGFIDYDISFGDYLADCLAGSPERSEVRAVVTVNRSRHGNDIEITVLDLLEVCGTEEAVVGDGVLKEFVTDFECGVMALHKGIDSFLVQVVADGLVLSGE